MVTRYEVKLLHRRQVAEHTMEFTLEKPGGFEYRAGQFGDLVLPAGSGLDESHAKHGFSFVSAPFEDTLRMATRMRESSAFKQAAARLPEGSRVALLALWGSFTLHKNTRTPALFLTGGIGITPVRSIICQALHEDSGHEISLIYSNRSPEQAAYHAELQQLSREHPRFHYLPVFTASQGHVSAQTLREHGGDIARSICYLSGPMGMVKDMRALLVEAGADEDHIRTEEFEGY
ncbi:FAD-dependent oxidoreductase [Comamonas flocculans]|uniref:FAD-dependent oxidoreductase n=1 Tax=Comamonas flocculans TaxID=2597701 RepID=A0A5B8RZF3_9BURK|nr:FAD-dependent oxidoreductase [Comamonas flocculans]QEA14122.1 FAD-dependent oxidoreductase [Comamonas flocculans]